jgi:hypothetical protein
VTTDAGPLFSDAFFRAAGEYRWMLDRGYPARQLVKLVGDRHRLSAQSRSALFRGVLSGEESSRTLRRLVALERAAGRVVVLDGHNALFSVTHYLRGVPVYRATDGLLRDVGGTARRLNQWPLVEKAVDALIRRAVQAGVILDVLLDGPVDFSREHARRFRASMEAHGARGSCEVIPSVDRELEARLHRHGPHACLSTGDAEVVRRSESELVDLAQETLEGVFGARIPDIRRPGNAAPVP